MSLSPAGYVDRTKSNIFRKHNNESQCSKPYKEILHLSRCNVLLQGIWVPPFTNIDKYNQSLGK
jgi:hypothetical protein